MVLLFIFGNQFLLNKLVTVYQPSPVTLSASQKYSAGIILGGYESYERNGNGFFNSASDRFIQIVKLYKQGHLQKIVVSGSRVEGLKVVAANFVQKQLIEIGIPPADIIVDGNSRNTFENAVFSKRLIDSAGLQPPYILVTSAMHMPRAKKAYEKAGLQVVGFPCNYVFADTPFHWDDYLLPKANAFEQWSYFSKELVGTVAYNWFGKA